MKVPRTKIAKTIASSTVDGKTDHKFVKEIAAYLLLSNRTGELDSIMRDVWADWSDNGVVVANVISAFPPSGKVNNDIKSEIRKIYPKAKRIELVNQTDKSVIAGVRVELPNELIDLTVKTKLNKFQQLVVSGKGM